jgi:hypothetical protein
MNVSHVIDGRGRVRVEGLNVSVNVLSTKFLNKTVKLPGELLGHQM